MVSASSGDASILTVPLETCAPLEAYPVAWRERGPDWSSALNVKWDGQLAHQSLTRAIPSPALPGTRPCYRRRSVGGLGPNTRSFATPCANCHKTFAQM